MIQYEAVLFKFLIYPCYEGIILNNPSFGSVVSVFFPVLPRFACNLYPSACRSEGEYRAINQHKSSVWFAIHVTKTQPLVGIPLFPHLVDGEEFFHHLEFFVLIIGWLRSYIKIDYKININSHRAICQWKKICLHHAPCSWDTSQDEPRQDQAIAKLTPEFDTTLMKILMCFDIGLPSDSTNQIVAG